MNIMPRYQLFKRATTFAIALAALCAISSGQEVKPASADRKGASRGQTGMRTAQEGFFSHYAWQTPGWSTFGLALAKGIATDGVQVGVFDTQTDVKVRYDDGSIRFAIVSAYIASAGTYGIRDADASAGTFNPTVPTASVAFRVAGATHTAVMPRTLGSDCWLNGPLVRECRSIVAPDNRPDGATALLRVYFDTRVYKDGKARVDVTVDNTKNDAAAGTAQYGVQVEVNGSSVFSRVATTTPGKHPLSAPLAGFTATSSGHGLDVDGPLKLPSAGLSSTDAGKYIRITSGTYTGHYRRIKAVPTGNTIQLDRYFPAALTDVSWELVSFLHPLHARWRKTFGANGYAEAQIVPDVQPLYDSKATFAYLPNVTAEPYAGGPEGYVPPFVGHRWDILGIGNHLVDMQGTGGREELGFRPMVTAQYLVHKTEPLRQQVIRYGDLSGSRKIHVTNVSDNSMVDIDHLPNFFYDTCPGNGTTGPLGNTGLACPTLQNGYFAERSAAHQPSVAFIPYLLTGDRYYADELKFWAEYCIISWGGDRGGSRGLLDLRSSIQTRALAWTIRDLTDAAAYLPDSDPHKAHFRGILENNLNNLQNHSVSYTGDPVLQSRPINQGNSIQPWMQAYLALALHHAARNGFTAEGGGTDLRDRLVAYQIVRLTTPSEWPLGHCCLYQLWSRRADGVPFTSLAEQWKYNNTNQPQGWMTGQLNPISGSRSPETRLAVLVGLDTGAANAQAAYEALMAQPDMLNAVETMRLSIGPAFAFAPMNTGRPRPQPPGVLRIVR